MASAIIAALPLLFKLVIVILEEIFSSNKRAREREKRFKLDQAEFIKAVEKSVEKLKREVIEDQNKSNKVQDELDKELKK